MKRAFACFLTFASLAALPAAAASLRSIENGIDVWYTRGDGTTFVKFDKDPIPKGFFCSKSAEFTGLVVLQGRPLATGIPGELGGADTIVQRLDDAEFGPNGEATTRIQLKALQLESVAPIKTACGDFQVRVTLSGTQPTTKMRIIKDKATSGRYVAPLKVRYKVSFVPTDGTSAKSFELVRSFTLAPAENATWGAVEKGRFASRAATLVVDTDGDQVPDTYLPKSSGNFQAGWSLTRDRQRQSRAAQKFLQQYDVPIDQCSYSETPDCHPEAAGIHCALPCAM